jgi:hemerythrin
MALFTWKETLSVGVAEFDTQHKRWLEIINELHEAMRVGKGKDILEQVFRELVQYTRVHFSAEEKYLTSTKYPAFTQHKALHDQLTAKILDFQKQLQAGKVALTLQVMNTLKDWLVNHIMEEDKKYSPQTKR